MSDHKIRWFGALVLALVAMPIGGCLEGGTRIGDRAQSDLANTDVNAPRPEVFVADIPVDTSRPDTEIRPDTPVPPDTTEPDLCPTGLVRCDGEDVVECVDNAWVVSVRCQGQEVCFDGRCLCAPSCGNAQCGSDGCGGRCGVCSAGTNCVAGRCECEPDCSGRNCGSDGCGGSCGVCGPAQVCNDVGRCACVPNCSGRVCGGDGCGDRCGSCPTGQQCTDAGQCVTPPTVYRAVYIDDRWSGFCNGSNTSGADIDSVALFSPGGALIGYFVAANGQAGSSQCQNDHQDADAAIGAPGGANADYISLQGGWVVGRFGQGTTLQPGQRLTVYEFDDPLQGGTAEPYSVYMATTMGCANRADKYSTCLSLISDTPSGQTDFTLPLSAF